MHIESLSHSDVMRCDVMQEDSMKAGIVRCDGVAVMP